MPSLLGVDREITEQDSFVEKNGAGYALLDSDYGKTDLILASRGLKNTLYEWLLERLGDQETKKLQRETLTDPRNAIPLFTKYDLVITSSTALLLMGKVENEQIRSTEAHDTIGPSMANAVDDLKRSIAVSREGANRFEPIDSNISYMLMQELVRYTHDIWQKLSSGHSDAPIELNEITENSANNPVLQIVTTAMGHLKQGGEQREAVLLKNEESLKKMAMCAMREIFRTKIDAFLEYLEDEYLIDAGRPYRNIRSQSIAISSDDITGSSTKTLSGNELLAKSYIHHLMEVTSAQNANNNGTGNQYDILHYDDQGSIDFFQMLDRLKPIEAARQNPEELHEYAMAVSRIIQVIIERLRGVFVPSQCPELAIFFKNEIGKTLSTETEKKRASNTYGTILQTMNRCSVDTTLRQALAVQ